MHFSQVPRRWCCLSWPTCWEPSPEGKVNETSAHSHFLQLQPHSPVAADAGKISVLPAPTKNQPYQLQYKSASTKDISCLNLPYSPQPSLILFPKRDEVVQSVGMVASSHLCSFQLGQHPGRGICVCVHVCVVNRNRESVLYSEGRLRCGRLRILTYLIPPSAPSNKSLKKA